MPDLSLITVLQVLLGLGLLNVWVLRANRATPFRGGASQSLKDEFAVYGLPTWFFFLVGALKVGAGLALLVGLWVPALVLPAAVVVTGLMLGALAMHLKANDPAFKSVPALLMLALSVVVWGAWSI